MKISSEEHPCKAKVDNYLDQWQKLDNYRNQEHALDKLFIQLCPKNDNIEDVLIKCSALNDFYSTNIFDIHSVAQHILALNIDKRLAAGDYSLIDDIANVEVGENGKRTPKRFYSFATKYCSHHYPELYAIYDNYVDKLLCDFRRRDNFCSFTNADLKDYPIYVGIIKTFQKYYGLEEYSLKQIDQYLWQLGKELFSPYKKDEK